MPVAILMGITVILALILLGQSWKDLSTRGKVWIIITIILIIIGVIAYVVIEEI